MALGLPLLRRRMIGSPRRGPRRRHLCRVVVVVGCRPRRTILIMGTSPRIITGMIGIGIGWLRTPGRALEDGTVVVLALVAVCLRGRRCGKFVRPFHCSAVVLVTEIGIEGLPFCASRRLLVYMVHVSPCCHDESQLLRKRDPCYLVGCIGKTTML
jgi:hypothetical protein